MISHVREDEAGLEKLKALTRRHGLAIRDAALGGYAANGPNDFIDAGSRMLHAHIEWCRVMVVYVTPGARDNELVHRQILRADTLGKRIVGVWGHDHAGCEPPPSLDRLAQDMVAWNDNRLVDAISGGHDIDMARFQEVVRATNKLEADIQPIVYGLFGEIGSVLSAHKKRKREGKAYAIYESDVVEDLGDAFWYFTALAQSAGVRVEELLEQRHSSFDGVERSGKAVTWPPSEVMDSTDAKAEFKEIPVERSRLDRALDELGQNCAEILGFERMSQMQRADALESFAANFLTVADEHRIGLARILETNAEKTVSRFCKPNMARLPDFDRCFPISEQLPRQFAIFMQEREDGKVHTTWDGRSLGNPLTDSIAEDDGFRYHDAVHLAHVAMLHWSPTMRGLFRRKRKSDTFIDETQDGGRAIVVEEGLAAWLFSKAKRLDYFEGHQSVSMDILNQIRDFVSGYEVEECPMSLWEKCILDGYAVFRRVRRNKGGIVLGDRERRSIRFEPLER